MATWDVFHSERLEAEKSLSTEAVREALARGELVEDDLIRPSGETRWGRLGDSPEFGELASTAPPPEEAPPPALIPFEPPTFDREEEDEAESALTRSGVDPDSYASTARGPAEDPPVEFEVDPPEDPAPTARQASSVAALPVLPDEETQEPDLPEIVELGDGPDFEVMEEDDEEFEEYDPQDEDDEAAGFTLSRNSAEKVEELDLAAMVDVAFQLVLFFLVTAQVVLYKTLEIPHPDEDKPPEAAAQARTRSIDELEKDYILVEVDAAGAIKVDRQPVAANRATLVEKLRASRETTDRRAMLLSADFATRHKNAVLVFDVANEIDLQVAIAQPSGKK